MAMTFGGKNLKGILFIVMAIENDNSSIFSGTRGAATSRHAIYSGCHSLTAFPQTTLRKRWKISAALSVAVTFHFSNRQTVYKSYFISFVVFPVCSRFCLITVICSDSVLFLCSRKAEYTRLGRECEALCALTWWMCKSILIFGSDLSLRVKILHMQTHWK